MLLQNICLTFKQYQIMRRFVSLLTIMLISTTMCMAGMSNSRLRKEARFLTDKMAYELDLTVAQYNDVYEINYDFIDGIRDLMDEVVLGFEWALDDYYMYLDVRNDDLRWVLSSYQYHKFMQKEYFFRPVHVTNNDWAFRVYVYYGNRNHFFRDKPYHYRSYCGAHSRFHVGHVSFYQDRHNHSHYPNHVSIRHDKHNFATHRHADFGSVSIRPNTNKRPETVTTRISRSSRTPNKVSSSKPSHENANSSRNQSNSKTRKENVRDTQSSSQRTPTATSRSQRTTVTNSNNQSSRSQSSSSPKGGDTRSSRTTKRSSGR